MVWNYSKLKGRIKEICDTQERFATEMGMERTMVNLRLNNKVDFTREDIIKACDVLDIDKSEIPAYFFCEMCCENTAKQGGE